MSPWCLVPSAYGVPPPLCNSHALVEAKVGVRTVLIWYLSLIRYHMQCSHIRHGYSVMDTFVVNVYVQGYFIPKTLKLPKPKPAPKPRAKASSKASSSAEHV